MERGEWDPLSLALPLLWQKPTSQERGSQSWWLGPRKCPSQGEVVGRLKKQKSPSRAVCVPGEPSYCGVRGNLEGPRIPPNSLLAAVLAVFLFLFLF